MAAGKCSRTSAWGGPGDDAAVIDDGDLVAQALRLFHVVGGQQDGLAACAHGLDQRPEVASGLGVEAGGGFVEKDQVRVVDQRDGQQQALALAAGELARVALEDLATGCTAGSARRGRRCAR
jgi:hypothetical protein